MSPAPLSAASAERLGRAAELADSLVDDGVPAATALAKAAAQEAVPYSHVPFLTRAFNTGRAVRQLGEGDPWQKAADHPVATPEEVYAAISSRTGPEAPAVSTQKAADDYARPPTYTSTEKAAAAPPTLPPLSPVVRAIVDRLRAESTVKAAAALPPVRALGVEGRVAAALDELRDRVLGMTAAGYGAVKAAALYTDPATADVFAFVEERHPYLARTADGASKLASVALDPTVGFDHPAVRAARLVAELRAAYPVAVEPTIPSGTVKVAADGAGLWYRSVPPQIPPGNGTVDLEPPAPVPVPDPGLVISPPTISAVASAEKFAGADLVPAPKPAASSAFGRGFGSMITPFTSGPIGAASAAGTKIDDWRDQSSGRSIGNLEKDLARISEQGALQDIVADPRLSGADPKAVIETYRTLASLAPQAMRNPAVAADFIHRGIHTGPPSLFDLNQLVTLEKNLAQTRNYHTRDAEEDEQT